LPHRTVQGDIFLQRLPDIQFRSARTVLSALLLCLAAPLLQAAAAQKPAIVGYVFPQNHILAPGEIAAAKLTRICYAFANIQNGRIALGFPDDDRNIPAAVALKRQNAALTVLISVGGWSWSGAFSDMALTPESRGTFIDSAVAFVDKYQLDGLDIDWEYPGLPGATNNFHPEDKQNYTALLKELRHRFDREEKRLHRRLYITVAVGTEPDFLTHTQMNLVQKYVDSVDLMAYDYYEPDSGKITGNHAPLFVNPADPKHVSADASVHQFEEAGVPAAKLVLGVPFYGHIWGNVPPVNNGLFQPGSAIPNAYSGYGVITSTMLDHGFTRYWDSASSVPYLYNPDKRIFVSYEDPESLALKCNYVLGHHLGGIMFWDYSGDPSESLLNAVDAGLGLSSVPAPSVGAAPHP
jgi:chitinase